MHLCPWSPRTSLAGSCLQNGLAYPTLINSSLLEVSITCRAIKKGWGKKGKPLWPLGSLSWWAWCHVMLIAWRCWETEDEECLSAQRLGLRFQGKLALPDLYSTPLERTISKFRQRGICFHRSCPIGAGIGGSVSIPPSSCLSEKPQFWSGFGFCWTLGLSHPFRPFWHIQPCGYTG